MIEELWFVWAFALMVGLAVAAAIVIGRTGRERLPTLSPHHAAGAAILGVIGWEVAIYLPGSVQTLTVAILPGPGEAALPSALFVLTQGVYVAATVVAVVFVLRQHVWAAILAIGLCLVRIGLMTMNLSQFVQRAGDDPSAVAQLVPFALLTVPAAVAIWLFAQPLTRGKRDGVPERSRALECHPYRPVHILRV